MNRRVIRHLSGRFTPQHMRHNGQRYDSEFDRKHPFDAINPEEINERNMVQSCGFTDSAGYGTGLEI